MVHHFLMIILQKNLLENRCTARTTLALLDWGKDGESTVELKNGFDVIVGADCVFNENRMCQPSVSGKFNCWT